MTDAKQGHNLNKPFFSIIIPAYNVEKKYFIQCVESLIQQTFHEIEIIIVDDGSRKECAEFYDELSETDFRIKVIHQENMGVSAARNNGVWKANSEWIMFVDSDDWIELDCCEKLHNLLCANTCEIVLFNHIKEYSNGFQRKQKSGLESNTLYNTDDVKVKECFYRRAMAPPNIWNDNMSTIYYSWDKVYSREFLVKNNIQFPVGLPKSEDKVFVLRCFERMRFLLYIEDTLYHYRINEQSVSNKYSQDVDEERRLLSKYLEEIARRMDIEMATLTGNPSYNTIYHDYIRFVFGIISEVLFSKYYHKDYPGTVRQRNKEVTTFLKSEPFRSAIDSCKYSELGTEAKMKKFMLTHSMTTLFCRAKKAKRQANGQVSQQ